MDSEAESVYRGILKIFTGNAASPMKGGYMDGEEKEK